jgi:formylglycine-generating enzyme required for sulfatase activity
MSWQWRWPCFSCLLLIGSVWALSSFLSSEAGADTAFQPKVDKLEQKNYSETIPGTEVKFEMIAIPGGTFLMGSPATEPGRADDEGPQHPVQIRPFWMEKTETTWDEFDVYFKEMGVESPEENEKRIKEKADAITGPTKPYADETFGHGRDGPRPVMCITHHMAMEYCRWLSSKTGKLYRLPTEAEWEWACRAGTTTAYSFGDDPKKLDDYAWYAKNSEEDTHPVGQKKPNPWGLYDMHGNLAEWCVDMYQKDFYSGLPADKLSLGPVNLPTKARFSHVARGGSWTDDPNKLRSAARRGSEKSWIKRDPQRPQSIWWLTDAELVGFRIIRPVEEQQNLKGLRSLVTRESPDYIDKK